MAVYGAGRLLACAIIAISGVVAAWLAALFAGVALAAVADLTADAEEIKERAHR